MFTNSNNNWQSRQVRPVVTAAVLATISVIGFAAPSATAADFADRSYQPDDTVRPYDDRIDRNGVTDEAYEDALRRFDENDRVSHSQQQRYQDPNYDDRYVDDPSDDTQPDGDVYAAPNKAPPHYRGSLKDDPYVAAQPYRDQVRERYNVRRAPRRPTHHAYAHCLPRRAIKQRLRHQGWRRFRIGEVRGDIAHIFAKRAHAPGRYKLAVDRCTGDIVSVLRHPRRQWRHTDQAWRQSVWNRPW